MAHKPGQQHETPRCEREPEVVQALAEGELPPDLLRHAATCAVCREVSSAARELQYLLATSLEEPLEPAASMWWRLNLRKRRENMNRAQLPLVWMERICGTILPLAVLAALWQIFARTTASGVLTIGLAALSAVALPVTIALWRWSRS